MLRRAENVRLSRTLFGRVTVHVGKKPTRSMTTAHTTTGDEKRMRKRTIAVAASAAILSASLAGGLAASQADAAPTEAPPCTITYMVAAGVGGSCTFISSINYNASKSNTGNLTVGWTGGFGFGRILIIEMAVKGTGVPEHFTATIIRETDSTGRPG